MPKAEAADFLGVSTREIERKAAAGRLTTKRVRLESDRSDRTVYSCEDLQRIRQERESGALQLAPRGPLANATQLMQTEALTALMAAVYKPLAPRLDRAWVTLDEAAEYSGLPAHVIAEHVRSRQIFAIGRGVKTWRVLRASLDDLGRKLGGLNPARVPKAR